MNDGTQELPAAARGSPTTASSDEPDTPKREPMKAEVRLAKTHTTVVSAEFGIKVLSARPKAATE